MTGDRALTASATCTALPKLHPRTTRVPLVCSAPQQPRADAVAHLVMASMARKDKLAAGAGLALGRGAKTPGEGVAEGEGVRTGLGEVVVAAHPGAACHTPLPRTAPWPPLGAVVTVMGPRPSENGAYRTMLSGRGGGMTAAVHSGAAKLRASLAVSATFQMRNWWGAHHRDKVMKPCKACPERAQCPQVLPLLGSAQTPPASTSEITHLIHTGHVVGSCRVLPRRVLASNDAGVRVCDAGNAT